MPRSTINGTAIDLDGKEMILDADQDTTITSDTDDQIDFKTGGTDRMVISSAGKVGIGVTPAKGMLHIQPSARTTNFDASDHTTYADIYVHNPTDDDTCATGIAFATDASSFDNGASGIACFSGTGDSESGLAFITRPNGAVSAERMRITSSGNVGIGTSPTQKLTVNAGSTDTAVAVFTGNDTNRGLKISTATANSQTDMLAVLEAPGQHSGSYEGEISFKTANTERMRIDKSGAVRIANTSGTLFDSSSATGTVAATSLQVSTNGSTVAFFNRLSSDGQVVGIYKDGTNVGSISAKDGDIAIGTGDTGLRFIDGSDAIAPHNISANSGRHNLIDLGTSGSSFDDIFATNTSIQSSDANKKNTITDSDLGLDFINRLSPKSYIFNDRTRVHYGLIAQDVETVLSDIKKPTSKFAGFVKDDKENFYGLRYAEFISPMIQAIKDLKAEVDTLKAKVTALEGS